MSWKEMVMEISSYLVDPKLFGNSAVKEFRSLTANQPLIIERDYKQNSITCTSFNLITCGYVKAEQAAIIAPRMDLGEMWLCKVIKSNEMVIGKRLFRSVSILLWSERATVEETVFNLIVRRRLTQQSQRS